MQHVFSNRTHIQRALSNCTCILHYFISQHYLPIFSPLTPTRHVLRNNSAGTIPNFVSHVRLRPQQSAYKYPTRGHSCSSPSKTLELSSSPSSQPLPIDLPVLCSEDAAGKKLAAVAMAKSSYTLLFGALVVLALLASPIACTRKLAKPNKHRRPTHKPGVRARSNHTATPSASDARGDAYGSGGWLSAGATYYGAPNGDGSDG